MPEPDEKILHESAVKEVIDDEIERLGGGGSDLSALVTTKGDLIAASGPATLVRVPVGATNFALLADSSAPAGVAWANVIIQSLRGLGVDTPGEELHTVDGTGNPRNTLDDGDGGSFFFGLMTQGFAEDYERLAAPPAPSNGFARVFCQDNGSGKHQLAVLFPTGAIQVIATEP